MGAIGGDLVLRVASSGMVNFREKIRSVFCLTALIETWLWNVSRQG
jgi:hypothetical protein